MLNITSEEVREVCIRVRKEYRLKNILNEAVTRESMRKAGQVDLDLPSPKGHVILTHFEEVLRKESREAKLWERNCPSATAFAYLMLFANKVAEIIDPPLPEEPRPSSPYVPPQYSPPPRLSATDYALEVLNNPPMPDFSAKQRGMCPISQCKFCIQCNFIFHCTYIYHDIMIFSHFQLMNNNRKKKLVKKTLYITNNINSPENNMVCSPTIFKLFFVEFFFNFTSSNTYSVLCFFQLLKIIIVIATTKMNMNVMIIHFLFLNKNKTG